MKLWLYTDDDGRLQGMNPNDMSGNTGWQEAVDASLLGDDPMSKPVTDERGIALYRVAQGVVMARTQEEMDADYIPSDPQPTPDERMAALEAQNEMLTECLLEMSALVYA